MSCPLLLTHCDPDLYPARSLPLLHELVIHILAYGEVWLKEVDLLLNSRIRAELSNPHDRDIFKSLVDTGRIKVLIPDETIKFDDNPHEQPLLAIAKARDGKRPLKSKLWYLKDDVRRYCYDLDDVLGRAARESRESTCRPRTAPPREKNEFAERLHAVLIQDDITWRTRRYLPFHGITDEMAVRFAEFSQDVEAALRFLRKKGVNPNAVNGFYRSLAYQCADQFPEKGAARSMKNLVQSVYTYCELERERAAGTYGGNRLAEMPLDHPGTTTDPGILRVELMLEPLKFRLTPEIGRTISEVLEECEKNRSVMWDLVGNSSTPEQDFRAGWAHICDAFARRIHCAPPAPQGLSKGIEHALNAVLLMVETGALVGAAWVPDALKHPLGQASLIAASAVISFNQVLLAPIRSAHMDLKRTRIRDDLNAAASLRLSRIY